jgi:hypothetical protein
MGTRNENICFLLFCVLYKHGKILLFLLLLKPLNRYLLTLPVGL